MLYFSPLECCHWVNIPVGVQPASDRIRAWTLWLSVSPSVGKCLTVGLAKCCFVQGDKTSQLCSYMHMVYNLNERRPKPIHLFPCCGPSSKYIAILGKTIKYLCMASPNINTVVWHRKPGTEHVCPGPLPTQWGPPRPY